MRVGEVVYPTPSCIGPLVTLTLTLILTLYIPLCLPADFYVRCNTMITELPEGGSIGKNDHHDLEGGHYL